MKRFLFLAILIISSFFIVKADLTEERKNGFWEIAAIDTMKYSRDLAKIARDDPNFDAVIDRQVKQIAQTGATHVSIATPYDEEFLPFLKRWVQAARKHNLKIWFRGNFSGWEKWFDYPPITRLQHLEKTKSFILKNPDLFEDGDIFTPCPECENGGPGDPRKTGDVSGFRTFMIEEYILTKSSFAKIGKNVQSNLNSMNGDVAMAVMDPKTTKALDGVVTVDHYVATPDKLASDMDLIAARSQGKVVLGEFGVPIPDINGNLNPKEQADWLKAALTRLASTDSVVGLNYWALSGSSTRLFEDNGTARPAADIVSQFYKPTLLTGKVVNVFGNPVAGVNVKGPLKKALTGKNGQFWLPIIGSQTAIVNLEAKGFKPQNLTLSSGVSPTIKLSSQNPSFWEKLYLLFH